MGFIHLWRSRVTGEPGLLKGIRAICRYCRISPHTFYSWKDEYHLPVAILPDGRYCTSKILIDDWLITLWKEQNQAADEAAADTAEVP